MVFCAIDFSATVLTPWYSSSCFTTLFVWLTWPGLKEPAPDDE